MGEIIDIKAELEYKKAVEREKFWAELALLYSIALAEKLDQEIMADIEKEDGNNRKARKI